MTKGFTDLDNESLDALIERIKDAKEHNLALSPADLQLLMDALHTLAHLQMSLEGKNITLHKLRKLLGIVSSSEKFSDLVSSNDSKPDDESRQSAGNEDDEKLKDNDKNAEESDQSLKNSRKKKKPKNTVKPTVIHHQLAQYNKGDDCPDCLKGTLYKYEPAKFIRIVGNSPFTAEQHISERLRCSTCGLFFTAELPEHVKADGGHQMYGYSARCLMAINKYYSGSPFYRQESLQNLLGVSITASTIFDQVKMLADCVHPVFNHLEKIAANAVHFHLDDTTHRILDQQPIEKKQRRTGKDQIRTGVFASGLVATLKDGNSIVLFQSNIGHAGEMIDGILASRTSDLPQPILMSDALSANQPVTTKVIKSLCNAHGRRQFVDVISHFNDEVTHILNRYKIIWKNEKEVKKNQLSNAERLAFHQEHSLPIMEEIKLWGQHHLDTGNVEENSGLGKAIRYFIKHFDGLTRFCTHEGAKLDNNEIERQLKLIVRGRKNFMFYKTEMGAEISDIITSLIATGERAEINIFDYLKVLQQNHFKVSQNPERWLPWNYQENLMVLAEAA